jgi:hypothetical protein
MDGKVQCTICGRWILPQTAESNAGYCAQCVKDPAKARSQVTQSRFVDSWEPSAENLERHILSLLELALEEAQTRFSAEGIRAFMIYADPHFEYLQPQVVTDAQLSDLPEGGMWDPEVWFSEAHSLATEHFQNDLISRLARKIHPSPFDVVYQSAGKALLRLRGRLREDVFMFIAQSGMSNEELLAVIENLNPPELAVLAKAQLNYSEEVLAVHRENYRIS